MGDEGPFGPSQERADATSVNSPAIAAADQRPNSNSSAKKETSEESKDGETATKQNFGDLLVSH
jgi:hypothetical protein